MKISLILIIFFLSQICLMPSHSLIDFQYKCIGTDATTTTYSYLKEPRIDETGYTRGMKSSSFNYLENGTINMEENIRYNYGNGTNISNSSVSHRLNVDFKGDRGISEFFAKGFFGNNRWLSAWKKIRYEESPNVEIDGEPMHNRPSKEIKVTASAAMDTFNRTNYKFNYNSKITNGTIEIKDSTGWTNRSGARQYDWEYESLTSGEDLDITNNLFESERIVPAGGLEGEWLPCWCSGTMPPIEQLDTGWPTRVTKSVLEANRILPSAQLSQVNATLPRLSPDGIVITSLGYRRTAANKQAVIGNIGFINKKMPLYAQAFYIQHSAPNKVAFSLINNSRNSSAAESVSAAFYPESKSLKVGLITSIPEVLKGPLKHNSSHKIEAKTDCKDGSCKGFEGIYTYDEGLTEESSVATAAAGDVPQLLIKNIDISLKFVVLDDDARARFLRANGTDPLLSPAKLVIYNIMVHNSGTVPLDDVTLTAELAKGIQYEASRYYEEGRGDVEAKRDPNPSIEEIKTIVTWKLNTMAPGELKSILLEAYVRTDVDEKEISVEAKGKASDGDELIDSDSTAVDGRYLWDDVEERTCLRESGTCNLTNPDWAKEI